MQNRLTKPSLLAIIIQLPLVFLVWPVLNVTQWLKWQVYYEVIVPMWCKLAKFADSAAFRWALWAIIAVELYMAVLYFFPDKFGLSVAF